MTEEITPLQARSVWCMRHFGADVQVHRRGLDDPRVSFGVMEFRCDGLSYHGARHRAYLTNGMSERGMPWREEPTIPAHLRRYRLELLAVTHHRADWVIDLLTEMAQYPFLNRTGFAFGDTIPVNDAVLKSWQGYVLGLPPNHDELNPLGIVADGLDGDPVFWLNVIGLKQDELRIGVDRGGEELLESLFAAAGHQELLFLDSERLSLLGGT